MMRSVYVIGFIFFAVTGLISLQVYFLHTDVELQRQILQKEINTHFKDAVHEEMTERRKIPLQWLEGYLADTTLVEVLPEWSEKGTAWQIILKEPGTDIKYMTLELRKPPQVPMTSASAQKYIINHFRENLKEFSFFYYSEEIGSGLEKIIESSKPDKLVLRQIFDRKLQSSDIRLPYRLVLTSSDSILYSKTEFFSETIPINIWGDKSYATALFGNPFLLLLGRMGYVLIISAFIMMATIIGYWWIFRKFYHQKALSKIKDDFIDQVTHEFKTPLSTLKVANEALLTLNVLSDQERTSRYLAICEMEINRLTGMVDEVLSYSMLDQPEFHYSPELLDPIPKIQDVVKTLSMTHGYPIYWNFKHESTSVHADPRHFQRVIFNLIENALIHNPNPDKEVRIDAKLEGLSFILTVQDNGPPIPKQIHHQIFQKYFRVKEGIKGYGIGLFYVKNIMQRMNAKIHLTSAPSGNTFTLIFPGNA
jgi:signal transduction histidine kinase